MLVALLSAVLLGGMQGVSCEMHGLGAAQTQAPGGDDMAAHAGLPDMAGMAGMAHHAGESAPGDGHCACTCIGDCTMVAPLATPPTAAVLLVTLVAPESDRPLDAEPAWSPRAAPDRLLPFANGPPPSALS